MQTSCDSQRNVQTSKALQQQQKTEPQKKFVSTTDNALSRHVASPESDFDENTHFPFYSQESLKLNNKIKDHDFDSESVASETSKPSAGVLQIPKKPPSLAASAFTPITTIVDPKIKLASSPEETFKLHYIEVQSRPTECVPRKHVKEGSDKKIVRRDVCANSKCTNVKCFLLHFKDGQKVQDLKLNLLQVMNELRLLHSLRSLSNNNNNNNTKAEANASSDSPISQISEQEMDNILRGLKAPIKLDKNESLAKNLLQIADEKLRSVVKRLLNEELLREIEKRFNSAIGFVCNLSNKKKKKNSNDDDDDDEEEKPQRHALYHANIIYGDDDTRTVFFIRPEYNTSKFEIVGIGQHTDKSKTEDSKTYYDMSFYFFPECGFLEENDRAIVKVASGLGLTKM